LLSMKTISSRFYLIIIYSKFWMESKKSYQSASERIAKEGRKFNVGLCFYCKRPSKLDKKLLYQCTQIIPISNDKHRGKYIGSTLSIFNYLKS